MKLTSKLKLQALHHARYLMMQAQDKARDERRRAQVDGDQQAVNEKRRYLDRLTEYSLTMDALYMDARSALVTK